MACGALFCLYAWRRVEKFIEFFMQIRYYGSRKRIGNCCGHKGEVGFQMIKAVDLRRFKQFKGTRVELEPFSILMGENNSGKTSVLQAIWLALHSLHQGKLLTVDGNGIGVKVSKTGYYMFDVPFAPEDDLSSLFYNKISREGPSYDESSGAIIQVTDDRGNCFRLHLRELFKNLNFKLLTPEAELRSPELQRFEPLYISGFVGVHFQEERAFPAAVEAKVLAGDVNSIVRNIVLDLKLHDPEKFSYLSTLMNDEFGFCMKDIHFHEDDDLYISSEYEEHAGEGTVCLDFSSSGSGIMQILQILAVILRYCPEKTRVVLIDEPDAHLHGNLQVKFISILRRMQQKLGIQIILSTHSTAIIQNAEPEEVIPIIANAPVNRGLTCSEEVQRTIADRLDAYELGKAKISGKIAFFEDSDLSVLERMADAAHVDCFSGVNTIPMICGRGKDDKLPFSLGPVLRELLGRDIEIHVIRDSDGMPEEVRQELWEFAERNHVKLHILSRYEIENYVLSAELIRRAIVSEPRNAGKEIPLVEEIQGKIDEALRETIRGGIYKYNMILKEVLYKVRHNLLGNGDYTADSAERDMGRVYREYYELADSEELLKTGMGKEALRQALCWLSGEKGLRISRKGILRSLRAEDVCEEMKELLTALRADVDGCGCFGEADHGSDEQQEKYEQLSFLDM